MSNCPYCDTQINEEYNFCLSCERQVKCLECGSYLFKDKSKCLKCGSLVNKEQSSSNLMNSFSLEEEQSDSNYSRKINLSFTDSAIDKVSSVLSGYVPLTSPKSSRQVTQSQQQLNLPFIQTSLDRNQLEQSETIEEKVVETTVKTTVKNVSDNSSPSDYFEKDGNNFLISSSKDYKGKSKKLQQQRFSILYVWAYNILYESSVPHEHLIQASQKNEIHDQNYSTYLKEIANVCFTNIDGSYKLNLNGRTQATKIQTEIQDPELSGLEYWHSNRKKSSRSSRTIKEDLQQIEEWINLSSRFDDFDVRQLKTTAEFAILSIYDITKEIKVEDAINSSLAYEYLTKRYKTVPVKRKNFNDTLSGKRYKNFFERNSEGLYYLTQESESLAESWINQVKAIS